jgi:menaquinone-9 beta-reductase
VIALGETDVLVVGGGPGGALTAAGLAGQGTRVLLVDPHVGAGDPAAASHSMLLSGPAIRGIASLGLRDMVPVHEAATIDLRFGSRSRRTIATTGAGACDAGQLRRALLDAAAGAGTQCLAGTIDSVDHGPDGYRAVARVAGGVLQVTARHVVLATGSASHAALMPDKADRETEWHQAGVACAQRFHVGALADRILLALPVPVTPNPDEELACVWAVPDAAGTMTICTARTCDGELADPEELLGTALRTLVEADPGFGSFRSAGPLVAGALNSGFSPERVKKAQVILVGDAAGLVNPFTGEGLSYAVQSARLAAHAILAHGTDPGAARRAYARSLARAFVGYFETARHASRRYHLAWRILAAAAGSDHPFFAKGRRAILFPEGFSELNAVERMSLDQAEQVMLGPFLLSCDEVAISTVRREWPFLARLVLAGENLGEQQLRPAVPFFAALIAAGGVPEPSRGTVGAAIELAILGALALLGPLPPTSPGRGVDWVVTSSVVAGDFLLAQASRLIAESAPEVSWSFADWLGELAALRAGRLAGQPVSAGDVYASLLEFPARIGAQLGGAPHDVAAALRSFGHECGVAFLHAEDVLALTGERTRLDTTLTAMLQGSFSGIPDSLGCRSLTEEELAADPGLRSAALVAAAAGCEGARRRAVDVLSAVPNPSAVAIMREFIEAVAVPATVPYPVKAAVPSGVPQPVGPS